MAKVLNDDQFFDAVKEGITLVDFYADWCGPCKMVAPIIDELSQEVEGAQVIKVNVDESAEVAAKYGIRSIPTFVLIKDGEEVERSQGAQPNKQFYLDLINKAS